MRAGARRLSQSLSAVGAVLRSPDLRRAEVAFAGFGFAEYATWVAILVYAYEAVGPTGAGVAAVVQLVPSALVAPFASVLGDLVGGRRSLLIGYGLQASALAAAGIALGAGAPVAVVFVLAALAATTITFTRPTQWAIQASLAETPEQLMAANVTTSSIESGSMLVGPATAGVLLAASGPWLVFAVSAACLAASAGLVSRIGGPGLLPGSMPVSAGRILRELRTGLSAVMADRRAGLVIGLIAARSVAIGALDVLAVVLAFRLLGMGRPGAGYLNAAFGGGSLVGAAGAVALVGRSRLSRPLVGGLALLGLCLAVIAALPNPAFALLMLSAGGLGGAFSEVAGRTMLQRLAPGDMLARVFGVLEGLNMAALAVGSIAVPALVALLGVRWTMVTLGGVLPTLVLITGTRLRAADAAAPAPDRRLGLLRQIDMFATLDPPTAERLATALVAIDVDPGTVIVRQGDTGDRFYVVADGEVDVAIDGRPASTLGPGDHFGEIALLRDVPRTGTVTARTVCRLYSLEREEFLAALRAHPAAAAHGEAVARERYERIPGQGAG
jgi:MFS family permease